VESANVERKLQQIGGRATSTEKPNFLAESNQIEVRFVQYVDEHSATWTSVIKKCERFGRMLGCDKGGN
jgi:hypothetical protein